MFTTQLGIADEWDASPSAPESAHEYRLPPSRSYRTVPSHGTQACVPGEHGGTRRAACALSSICCASIRQTRDRKTVDYKKVLVPVDFSGASQRGLEYAIGVANELGAKIVLLHATYLGYIYSAEGTPLYDIP